MRRHRLCLARRSRRMDRGGRSFAAFVRHTRIRALWAVLPWVLILASSRIQEVEAAFPTQLVSPYESAGNEKAFLGQLRPMLDHGENVGRIYYRGSCLQDASLGIAFRQLNVRPAPVGKGGVARRPQYVRQDQPH
jgi:hypothetical protein